MAEPAPPARSEGGEWLEELKACLEQDKPRLASVLGASRLALRGATLVVEIPAPLHGAWKMIRDGRACLQETARRLAGREVGLEVVLKEEEGRPGGEGIVQELKNDKKIKSLRERIKGSVIAVESVKGGKDG